MSAFATLTQSLEVKSAAVAEGGTVAQLSGTAALKLFIIACVVNCMRATY